jgi:hypothetical protein
MLAKLAAHYGLGPIVSIDPHTRNLSEKSGSPSMVTSTYEDFLHSLRQASVEEQVEVHREYSQAVSGVGLGQFACCGLTVTTVTKARKRIFKFRPLPESDGSRGFP